MKQANLLLIIFAMAAPLALAHGRGSYYHNHYDHIVTCSSWEAKRLYQMDFENGTYILDEPGYYCLGEDIKFDPNNADTLRKYGEDPSYKNINRVLDSQFRGMYGNQIYDPMDYGIGFFAAIAISAHNVTIDLNGCTLEASPEFSLMQRFYANIELGAQPFIGGQGPASFGELEGTVHDLTIKNGVIGMSPHHGIHGNAGDKIRLYNLVFRHFEVAAIALNGAKEVEIKNVDIKQNKQEIPVLGIWSTGRFIQPYLEHLKYNHPELTLRVQGEEKTVTKINEELVTCQANVYEDLVDKRRKFISFKDHPTEFDLFHNVEHMMDGNVYGVLFNKLGIAIGGFPQMADVDDDMYLSSDICIDDVHIENLRGCHIETKALKVIPDPEDAEAYTGLADDKPQTDPVGSIIQLYNRQPGHAGDGNYLTISSENPNMAHYIGNVVSNAQAIVAKGVHQGLFADSHLDVTRNSIGQEVIDWIERDSQDYEAKLSFLLAQTNGLLCNGDMMFHVGKGNIGFKLDNVKGLKMTNSGIENLENRGPLGSLDCYYSECDVMPGSHYGGYNAADVRGISIAGSQDVDLYNIYTKEITSYHGSAWGIDVHTDSSDISIKNAYVHDVQGGANEDCDAYHDYNDVPNPNRLPFASGLNIRETTNNVCYSNLHIEEVFSMKNNYAALNDRQHLEHEHEEDYDDQS